MNRDAIKKTAICHFSKKDKCFIVQSPLFDMVMGAAETEKEAWDIFYDLIDATYIKYLEGNLFGYERRGRPSKGGIPFHAKIKPNTKGLLVRVAKQLQCSQGEVLDYLLFAYTLEREPETKQAKGKYRLSRRKEGAA